MAGWENLWGNCVARPGTQEPLLARDLDRKVLHLGNGNSPLPEERRDCNVAQLGLKKGRPREAERPIIKAWKMKQNLTQYPSR